MGCDINGLIERRVNGKWICWRTLNCIHSTDGLPSESFQSPAALDRNYGRFAALAGVRGDGPQARGLPDDASDTAVHLFETQGDHTPSWLPIKDATRIFSETEHHTLRDFDQQYPAYFYFGLEDEIEGMPDDFRLVFWFDS